MVRTSQLRSASFGLARCGRTLALATAVLALLHSGIGDAAAGGVQRSFGTQGRWSLNGQPGCRYGSSHIFDMTVLPPNVFAQPAIGQQNITYVVSLMRVMPADGRWVNVAQTKQYAVANQTTRAGLVAHTFSGIRNYGPGYYFALIEIYWMPAHSPTGPAAAGVVYSMEETYRLIRMTTSGDSYVKDAFGGCTYERPF